MRFVVPISFGTWLVFALLVGTAALYVAAIFGVIYFLYFLVKAPATTMMFTGVIGGIGLFSQGRWVLGIIFLLVGVIASSHVEKS